MDATLSQSNKYLLTWRPTNPAVFTSNTINMMTLASSAGGTVHMESVVLNPGFDMETHLLEDNLPPAVTTADLNFAELAVCGDNGGQTTLDITLSTVPDRQVESLNTNDYCQVQTDNYMGPTSVSQPTSEDCGDQEETYTSYGEFARRFQSIYYTTLGEASEDDLLL